MALSELMKRGILKHIISQNVDGLHLKSGVPKDDISEVHGNYNLEKCESCHKSYMRDFIVREAMDYHEHKTSRKCDNPECQGQLYDSVINFDEALNDEVIKAANENGEHADFMLSLGSSMRVAPVNTIPIKMKWNVENL